MKVTKNGRNVKSRKMKIKTHFEFISESVKLAELQLCRSESCRDTGL